MNRNNADWKRMEIRKKREDERRNKLNVMRQSFDIKANNQHKKTYRLQSLNALRWRNIRIPKGYLLVFAVTLEFPLPRSEVEAKLDKAFGYLKKQEVKE